MMGARGDFMVKQIAFPKFILVFIGGVLLSSYSAKGAAPPWPALPVTPPIPTDNPQTDAKIHLGKELFFDARLSKDGTVSCNSCHTVMGGGTDNRAVSVGISGQKGVRSAPTVFNAAFNKVQFWDGRANSLEAQAMGPLTNPKEMGMDSNDAVVARLAQIPGYVTEFKSVFPNDSTITIDDVAKAIASYERTLLTPNSPYDRYVNGDASAISAQAIQGMNTAKSVGCIQCHSGANFNASGGLELFPTFTDNDYIAKYKLTDDSGDGEHNFRIQTWRNITLTAPYFHNGSVTTLPEAVRVMGKTQLNIDLTDQQVADIVEFMKTLEGDFIEQTMPRLPGTSGQSVIDSLD